MNLFNNINKIKNIIINKFIQKIKIDHNLLNKKNKYPLPLILKIY